MNWFKKKKSNALVPTNNIVANSTLANKITLDTSARKIKEGLSRETASTGTPIEDLHGAAKFMAQLSNIGGGSVETGGGGIKDGFNTVAQYVDAKAKVQVQSQSISSPKHPKRIKK